MTRYAGPAMSLGNMRENGVRSVLVACGCAHGIWGAMMREAVESFGPVGHNGALNSNAMDQIGGSANVLRGSQVSWFVLDRQLGR